MSQRVIIEKKNKVAVVSFNRPKKLNALDIDQFKAIIDAGELVNSDKEVRVVVLRGMGNAFCAGLDVTSMGGDSELFNNSLLTRTHGNCNIVQKAVWIWRDLQVPVIAAVHGYALGGGLQIMLAADIKFIKPDTQLSILEMKWGIVPDMAGTQLMMHTVRQDIIKELTYTHRVFSGEKAVEYGFATHLSDEPFQSAFELAEEIAS